MANKACNYTQEMWDSENFEPLKNCLMKMPTNEGMELASASVIFIHFQTIFLEIIFGNSRLLGHRTKQLFHAAKPSTTCQKTAEYSRDYWGV